MEPWHGAEQGKLSTVSITMRITYHWNTLLGTEINYYSDCHFIFNWSIAFRKIDKLELKEDLWSVLYRKLDQKFAAASL